MTPNNRVQIKGQRAPYQGTCRPLAMAPCALVVGDGRRPRCSGELVQARPVPPLRDLVWSRPAPPLVGPHTGPRRPRPWRTAPPWPSVGGRRAWKCAPLRLGEKRIEEGERLQPVSPTGAVSRCVASRSAWRRSEKQNINVTSNDSRDTRETDPTNRKPTCQRTQKHTYVV